MLPIFCQINFAKFVKISLEFVDFRADFHRNFTKSCRINKNYQMFAESFEIFAKFCEISLEFADFDADLYRNFTKSCRINKKYQIFAENCEHL